MADLIEKFVKLTDNGIAPERYRRWSALVMIAAILDRRVWTSIRKGMPLYPNLFVLLVAKPGVGKSMALLPARACVATQAAVSLSDDEITHENFVKDLGKRAKEAKAADEFGEGKATMALFLSEWGSFLKTPDNAQLAMLANIYDCGDYSASTISRGRDCAENLYINIVAGCTPAWFVEGFPPNSYEQGLPTRMHFIYSDEVSTDDQPDFEFSDDPMVEGAGVADKLFSDLNKLSAAQGFVRWSTEAGMHFNEWKKSDFAPKPSDPLLQGYNARRAIHAAKIAVLVAMARHPERLEIDLQDLKRSMEILFEAEPDMAKSLSAAGGNIYQLRVESTAKFIKDQYKKTGSPVSEWKVRQMLSRFVQPGLVKIIIDEMIAQQAVRVRAGSTSPNRKFSPGVM